MVICYCNLKTGCRNESCVPIGFSACYTYAKLVTSLENDGGKKALEAEYEYGCTSEDEHGVLMTCRSGNSPYITPQTIRCCKTFDYCNRNISIELEIPQEPTPKSGVLESGTQNAAYMWLGLSLAAAFVILVVVVGAIFFLRRRRKNYDDYQQTINKLDQGDEEESVWVAAGDSIRQMIEYSSGSGSGLPLLVQRTIARQLQLVGAVGKGRYGEVWRAKWRGETVAVKIFYTTDEESWKRETEIYQTVMLRHENILGFIAADIKGTGSTTQMLLVTDFVHYGSLYDYLKAFTFSKQDMLRLVSSAACGLSHLHHELYGTQGKPAIAHRDIKSKNILVKRDGTCVIADFGLAVMKKANLADSVDIPLSNPRVGTKRYMAPEVLTTDVNVKDFESFRQADMYSFGLVFWEIATRCQVDGAAEEYKVPFHDYYPQASDPSFDDMIRLVCPRRGDKGIVVPGHRPEKPSRWNDDDFMDRIWILIRQCWTHVPGARLTAMYVKQHLLRMLEADASRLCEKV